jgi:hypothetical protein
MFWADLYPDSLITLAGDLTGQEGDGSKIYWYRVLASFSQTVGWTFLTTSSIPETEKKEHDLGFNAFGVGDSIRSPGVQHRRPHSQSIC